MQLTGVQMWGLGYGNCAVVVLRCVALPCLWVFVLDFGWMGGNTRTRLYNLDDFLFLFVCMRRPPFDDGSDGRGRAGGEADGSSHVNDSTHCYLVLGVVSTNDAIRA